jgi:hypothetical protein
LHSDSHAAIAFHSLEVHVPHSAVILRPARARILTAWGLPRRGTATSLSRHPNRQARPEPARSGMAHAGILPFAKTGKNFQIIKYHEVSA